MSAEDRCGFRWRRSVKGKRDNQAVQKLRPTIWIGKQGCTDALIMEIATQLEKRKLVKIKALPGTSIDPRELAARAGGDLIDVRGRMFVLVKRQKKE